LVSSPLPLPLAELEQAYRTLESWLLEDAYPLWWTAGADHVRGGFHERLRLDATSTAEPRRARLHPRQIFAYSRAAGLGWRGPAKAAVEHGLNFFLAHYPRADHFMRALVTRDGAPLNDQAYLYDQAFALLGFAAAFAALGDARLQRAARVLHDQVVAKLTHPAGGFAESEAGGLPLSSNSHMHLLEASLAWIDLDEDPRWRALAAQIVQLALRRWMSPGTGTLREFFIGDWQPMPGEQGRVSEPGHQFEWAGLLLRFRSHDADENIMPAALRLIENAQTYGVDSARQAAVAVLLDGRSVLDARARLWPQAERLKAACLAAATTRERRYWDMTLESSQVLMRYLDTPVRGLWRDRMSPNGSFTEEPAPASSFYHIVGAIAEFARLIQLLKTDRPALS
jgi:mannose/cellobiose epimerase-like protein (N-acyl-D-glucosamine 2-epimerase family)